MSWKKVKLGDVLTESKIESKTSDPDKRLTVRLNLKGVEKRPYEAGVEGGTKYYVRKAGQFIYGKQNLFKGAFGIIPKELDGYESSSDIPAFDVIKDCLPEWIFYFLKKGDFYKSLERIATGTGSRRIQPSRLFEVEICLPSVTKQERIIKDCKLAEHSYDKINEELALQQTYLKRLRQSILQEAVQGKLTQQNSTDEPASKLLERIKAEKQKLVVAGKLKREKELPPITRDEIPFELPKGWVWCRFGEVIELLSGQHIEANNYNQNGIGLPYLTGPSDFGEINPIFTRWSQAPKVVAQEGDILVTVKGSGVGKLNVLNRNDVAIGRQLMAVRVSFILKDFTKLYLDSIFDQLQNLKAGIAIPGISREDILEKVFCLPPLVEQQSIVNKVGQLLQKINLIVKQVQQSQTQAQQLLQAVLKEVFGIENDFLSTALKEELQSKARIPFFEESFFLNLVSMNIIEILTEAKQPVPATIVWKQSEYRDDIEQFYAELKKLVDIEKKVIEEKIDEKSYLKLA
jgi:type I restriction enzyme S subunit